jgi:hypothetical protein
VIWARMLAYITGTVDQELPLRNEHLAAENRILRAQIKGGWLLCDAEKATLAEIAHRLRRKVRCCHRKTYGSPAPFSTCPGCLCRLRSPSIAGNFRMSRLAQYRCDFPSYKFLLPAAGHHPSVELANLYRLFLSPVGYCIFSAVFGTTLNLPCLQLNLHSTRVRRKASRLSFNTEHFQLGDAARVAVSGEGR